MELTRSVPIEEEAWLELGLADPVIEPDVEPVVEPAVLPAADEDALLFSSVPFTSTRWFKYFDHFVSLSALAFVVSHSVL
jgi:hypothetical protein